MAFVWERGGGCFVPLEHPSGPFITLVSFMSPTVALFAAVASVTSLRKRSGGGNAPGESPVGVDHPLASSPQI